MSNSPVMSSTTLAGSGVTISTTGSSSSPESVFWVNSVS